MKTKRYRIIYLIIAIAVAVFAVGYAFGWIADDRRNESFGFGGSSGSNYFAGGTGESDDPYKITDKYHMYNLAWLQNTGKFGTDKKYYFRVENKVDMGDMWLPPIGNDDYPFIGEFNGGGYIISNLKVTTNKLMLTGCPVANDPTYKFSNAVGMFGMTANSSAADAGKCKVSNFILQNPIVQVASVNDYSSGTDKKSVVGLAVGHVAGNVSSIGVLAQDGGNTTLDIQRSGYTTFNSILGELASGVSSSVTGGGIVGDGVGANYGSSYNLQSYRTRLKNIHNNGGASVSLPKLQSETLLAANEIMPLTIDEKKSTYTGSTAAEVPSSQNVGYIAGNQNKLQQHTGIKYSTDFKAKVEENGVSTTYDWSNENSEYFVPKTGQTISYSWTEDTVPPTLFKRKGSGSSLDSSSIAAMSKSEVNALPKGIRDILNLTTYDDLRLQQEFTYTQTSGTDGYGTKPKISYYGNEYTNVKLPNNGIWFKPKLTGTFRFVVYTHNNGKNFSLYKLTRNCTAQGENESETEYNQRYFSSTFSNATVVDTINSTGLPGSNILLYFEYEHSDLKTEYLIANDIADNGAYFVYLDIGTSAAADQSSVDTTKDVSAVDFIYNDVEISKTASGTGDAAIKVGDFIIRGSGAKYNSTKTSVGFKDYGTVLKIVFVRLVGTGTDKKTLKVSATSTTALNLTNADYVQTVTLT